MTIGTDVLRLESASPRQAALLASEIATVRRTLLEHPIYQAVSTLPRLRMFMRSHVFAVWDFMCLLKRLQRDLTSVQPLWRPPRSRKLARFINEVVLAEESDLDPDGQPLSHLELYLESMEEVGAPTAPFRRSLQLIIAGTPVSEALTVVEAGPAVREFVAHTLRTVTEGSTLAVLATFLYGREDLIPEMFARFLPRWEGTLEAPRFRHYVKRHIEIDGDSHGPLATQALQDLAGEDTAAWTEARMNAQLAIRARLRLWDGIHNELRAA